MANEPLYIKILKQGKSDNKFIFFLHGFTGSLEDWEETVNFIDNKHTCIGIDLPGHGKSPNPNNIDYYKSDIQTILINSAINLITNKKIILVGYSMGGRAALHFANSFPERIDKLILESTTPGIKTKKEKAERIKQDEKLADFIMGLSVREFVNFWMNIPLFASQKKLGYKKLQLIKYSKRKNSRYGLSNSVRGFGTGIMPHLWNDLKKFSFPVLLLTGELDNKFTEINKKMAKLIPDVQHFIANSCGHNIHLEDNIFFTNELNKFINN